MNENIVIKGAREHNLKNISLELPRNKFIVITGLSGSGKSTLAFDTLYAEGQRRYVESLSSYARQFLGLMNKPDVDSIDGLSPAISIEQKTTSKNPRSTVGTVTEIYDHLRLLYARVGVPYCPVHNVKIEQRTPDSIVDEIVSDYLGQEIMILAPIVRQKKGTYDTLINDLNKEGFSKVRVNGEIAETNEKVVLERYKKHNVEIIVDRFEIDKSKELKTRLRDAVELSLKKSEGLVIVNDGKIGEKGDKLYSKNMSCPECDITFEELEPRMFSFNSPFGACDECHGLGIKMLFDADLIIPDKKKSIADGAIEIYKNVVDGWRAQNVAAVAKHLGFDIFTPFNKITKKQMDGILYGVEGNINFNIKSREGTANWSHVGSWEGIIPQSQRLYLQTESDYRRSELEKFMRTSICSKCNGKRLKDKILAVKIGSKSIIDVTNLSIKDAIVFFDNVKLTQKQEFISKQVFKEIKSRLKFLNDVGLSYLSLSRSSESLSGGEAQRIRLATQIGSNLMGVLYILDEPSIGLHQRDNNKLIETLHHLRDLGNTLIVVEHDEDTIRNADYVVDMGPGAGIHGGEIVAEGTPLEIEKNPKSLTGNYLCGKYVIPVPKKRRPINASNGAIEIIGAQENNLKNINVKIPLKCLTVITGVSGSGKSSLVYDILYRALTKELLGSKEIPGKHKEIKIPHEVDKIIMIDQSPIGKTPRSNPATYIGVFDDIRKIFAATQESKSRGFGPGRYSFNVEGGRCEACGGDGLLKIEMNFLPDVYVPCDECKATRYNKETLEVRYKGKNISEVLNMSVEEAVAFFENIPSIKRKLQTLFDVGLGYIKLGQPSTTLSGGEAQRIKLTKELSKTATGNTVYLLDEPTTGLHFHDVSKLIEVMNRLVDKGNSIIVIEHNLDVIKTADWIIDLGPEGGDAGGKIVTTGTPEAVAKCAGSYTGMFLKKSLK